MPKLASYNDCTGCLACVDTCNHKAITVEDIHGLLYPNVNNDLCVDCKLCEKCCPIISPVDVNDFFDMQAFAGWAKDEHIRNLGASGGSVTALTINFMKQHEGNVSIYGAVLKDNRVSHNRATSLKELFSFTNSKYIQSNTNGIFSQVKNDLKTGMFVMFIGTPCQIGGLYGYLKTLGKSDKLITVELLCAGVLSNEALDIHLELFKSSKIYSFRNKEENSGYSKSQCTTIEIDGKPFRFSERTKDVFYRCFSSSILERGSCSNCKFASVNRVADITAGDFWGGSEIFDEYEKGVNVITANNDKADEFLNSADDLVIEKTTIKKAFGGNPRFYSGFKFIQFHPLRLFPEFFRKILPRKIWLSIVENKNPWRFLWGGYRVLTSIYIKLSYMRIKDTYTSLFNK